MAFNRTNYTGYTGKGKNRGRSKSQEQAKAQFKRDYATLMKKFGKTVQSQTFNALGRVGIKSAAEMKDILKKGTGISRKVGDEGEFYFTIDRSTQQGGRFTGSKGMAYFPKLEVGVEAVMGERGTRSEPLNFTSMVLTGTKDSVPVGKGTEPKFRWQGRAVSDAILKRGFYFAGNWGSGKGNSKFPRGNKRITKGIPANDFLNKTIEKTIQDLREELPDAVKQALLEANARCPWERG